MIGKGKAAWSQKERMQNSKGNRRILGKVRKSRYAWDYASGMTDDVKEGVREEVG